MKLFGTDGIRGIANEDLNVELCIKIGRAIAKFVKGSEIIVGKDTRLSGDMIASSISSGLCSCGKNVILTGVVPTPAIAYLTKNNGFDAGVMISASHNPYEYNGIKVFDRNGFKLNDDEENEIEKLIYDPYRCNKTKIGTIINKPDLVNEYINFLTNIPKVDFGNLRVAIDSANGSNYKIAKEIFETLKAKVFVTGNKPNGCNINDKCGSTYLKDFVKFCKKNNVDVGISFDGDGDRVIFVDEFSEIVDGDQIMAILAQNMKEKNNLKKDTIVVTVMSNMGLLNMAKENNISVNFTSVGDKNVLKSMRENGYVLGGEQSGHIISLGYSTTGDGLVTAILILSIMAENNEKLSKLKNVMKTLPQITVTANVKHENKEKFLFDSEIKTKIKEIEEEFNGNGRVLVRPSGTESVIRIMIEGSCEKTIVGCANKLAELITEKFGE